MTERIVVEPGEMGGQPTIRGLRITVAHLVRLVVAGWNLEQIREDFPFIEADDVHDALLYAAESSEVVTLVTRQPA